MSIYDVDGTSLSSAYQKNGSVISNAYNSAGQLVWTASGGSYTDTIDQAASIWRTEYTGDSGIVPLVLSTDQHSYLNASHGKILYDYLGSTLTWSEISASLNLGDVCAGTYSTTELGNAKTALASVPAAKQINILGNHDVWATSNTVITDDQFTYAQTYYFNNSSYNGNSRFENRGCEIMIDSTRHIKYLVISCFYFPDGVYYHYSIPEDAMDWILQQMSTVDSNDIIVLSHIQPLATTRTWYTPPTDGNPYSSETRNRNYSGVAPYGAAGLFEGLLAARKNKTSGTITDSDGIVHSYDFSSCTSDILCWLAGHAHEDSYAYDGGIVPVVLFDAYRYDQHPFFFINVDRTNERLSILKVDESPTIYAYTVPFTEVTP